MKLPDSLWMNRKSEFGVIFLRCSPTCHMMQILDALMDWGSTWGMKFNAKKCNIMRVSRSRKPLQHFYSLGSEILQEVSDAKYLGIQIDKKLDWNKHISTVAARGQSKLTFLNRNLKGCPKKLRDTAYISLIRPALDWLALHLKFGSVYFFNNWVEFLGPMKTNCKSESMGISPEVIPNDPH